MFFKKNARIELLTPALAKEIASMPGFPGERDVRLARLKFLHHQLMDGNFVGPNWAIAVNSKTGDTFRINGKHSSNMLASLSIRRFPADLLVTIDVFEFDDMAEDGARLYDIFDHPRSARTDADFMTNYRASYPELAGMDSGFLINVASGVDANIRNQPGAGPLFYRRHYGLYFVEEKYRQFAVWLYRFRETKNFSFIIGRSGVISEVLSNWTNDPAYAAAFWGYVFRGDHPDPNHESYKLLESFSRVR